MTAFNTRHKPSLHAMKQLRRIHGCGPIGLPAQEVNFTVRDKLLAFKYITLKNAPSDQFYKTHKPGDTVSFMYITEAGKNALYNPQG